MDPSRNSQGIPLRHINIGDPSDSYEDWILLPDHHIIPEKSRSPAPETETCQLNSSAGPMQTQSMSTKNARHHSGVSNSAPKKSICTRVEASRFPKRKVPAVNSSVQTPTHDSTVIPGTYVDVAREHPDVDVPPLPEFWAGYNKAQRLFHQLDEHIAAAEVHITAGIERANAREKELNDLIKAAEAEAKVMEKERE